MNFPFVVYDGSKLSARPRTSLPPSADSQVKADTKTNHTK